MEEVVRKKGLWIGLAVIGVIFWCVILCVVVPLLTLLPRQTVTYVPAPYVQPPAAEEGAAPQVYQGPIAGTRGWGPLGIVGAGLRLMFRLLFLGLLLMLGLRLLRRIVWGPRHWCSPCWGRYYHGGPRPESAAGPPAGNQGETGWGPPPWAHRGWHHHRRHWGPPPWWAPAPGQAGTRPAEAEPAEAEPGDEYSGPQE